MTDTIYMTRDAEQYPAPHVADVHPNEVENYRRGGWTEATEQEAATGGTEAATPAKAKRPGK